MSNVLSEIVESILEDDPDSTIDSSVIQGHIAAYESRIYDEVVRLLLAKGYHISE